MLEDIIEQMRDFLEDPCLQSVEYNNFRGQVFEGTLNDMLDKHIEWLLLARPWTCHRFTAEERLELETAEPDSPLALAYTFLRLEDVVDTDDVGGWAEFTETRTCLIDWALMALAATRAVKIPARRRPAQLTLF